LVRLIETMKEFGADGYKPYMIKGTDTATGQNVGFVTRCDPIQNVTRTENRVAYPVPGNKCGTTSASGTSGVSKHYISTFDISGTKYTMFGQHFLAFPTDNARCVQREAQASVMRDLIDTVPTTSEIIVFGDYNDYSDKVPDVSNSVPTSRVMSFLRDGTTVGAMNTTVTDDARTLVEVSQLITQSQRYTSIYDVNKLSSIDHILVSQNIYNNIKVGSTYIDHSYAGFTVSDHWPVILDFYTPLK